MPTTKHLVLDDDVYEALIGRRDMTGLPISRIGNSILRAHIAAVLLEDLLGEKLVESGRLSEGEYRDALEQALGELRRSFHPGHVSVEATANGRLIAGSWVIQSLLRPSDGSFQLLECWVRDSLQRPMEQHSHDADEYVISISGRSQWVTGGVPVVLRKGNMLQIPAGAIHSAVPLDPECHLLVATVPATPEYSARLE
jgi:quercetin dioxygenase-like cupin family protein